MTIKLTFLGTSDAIPTAARNHTATLLTYNGENILIDCGEGTQRQFRKAKIAPTKVTRLLITHWHGDHTLGIPGLLQTLNLMGYEKTLYIYGPKGTKEFIKHLLNMFAYHKGKYKVEVKEVSGKFLEIKDFQIEASPMSHGMPCNAYSFTKKDQLRIDKKKLKKFKIPSGPHLAKIKQGKSIKYKDKTYTAKQLTYKEQGTKISFVLDTKTNPKIVPFVKNSTLLVSEAQFSQSEAKLAKEHDHLTSKQAAEIAKKSHSKKLILTHISQRYQKDLSQILNEAKKVFKNTSLVKDLDVVEI